MLNLFMNKRRINNDTSRNSGTGRNNGTGFREVETILAQCHYFLKYGIRVDFPSNYSEVFT